MAPKQPKQLVSFRVDPALLERFDDYARNNGWAKYQGEGARGGDHSGRDSGRTALLCGLMAAVVDGKFPSLRPGPNPFPAETSSEEPMGEPMIADLVQGNRILPSILHNGERFVEAPPSGPYTIKLCNNSSLRRLAVVTVDGVNVVDGKNGAFDGSGYVLEPYQTIDIKGWLRTNDEVAAFEFRPNEGSYANATGRGTSNTGIVGIAVFDEQYRVVKRSRRDVIRSLSPSNGDSYTYGEKWAGSGAMRGATKGIGPNEPIGSTYCSTGSEGVATASFVPSDPVDLGAIDLGTGYGQRLESRSTTTTFHRASSSPTILITLRYAVRARLVEWGVPLPEVAVATPRPSAFPAAACPAPAGWRG